jgi:cardiolipin synthase
MRITANQVTFSRLVAMPFLALLLYGGHTQRTIALVIGFFVGLTDYLDGYLARKQGPTVLGGLMDPIADKVFLALAVLPFAQLGLLPWWSAAALLLRELLVTALRSSFELRKRTLRTTYFAKVKTWVQMFAVMYLLIVAQGPPEWLLTALLVGPSGGALIAGLVLAARRRFWRGPWLFCAGFAVAAAVFLAFGERTFTMAVIVATVAITWASGLDYVVVGFRELPGDLHWFDFVRILGAAALPLLGCLVLARVGLPAHIFTLISVELAHGGLDNLLAHHGAAASAWAWGARVLTASALLAVSLVAAPILCVSAALAVSGAATAVAFWRSRKYYLGFVDFAPPRST